MISRTLYRCTCLCYLSSGLCHRRHSSRSDSDPPAWRSQSHVLTGHLPGSHPAIQLLFHIRLHDILGLTRILHLDPHTPFIKNHLLPAISPPPTQSQSLQRAL